MTSKMYSAQEIAYVEVVTAENADSNGIKLYY
jgi:hypothetical protein